MDNTNARVPVDIIFNLEEVGKSQDDDADDNFDGANFKENVRPYRSVPAKMKPNDCTNNVLDSA